MSQHKDVIAEVEKSPEGPQIGALFDFDGTVIYGYSAVAFIREQVKRGDLSPHQRRNPKKCPDSSRLAQIRVSQKP